MEQYFLSGALIVLLIICLFLFKPFLTILVVGGTFSVALYPLYKWINKKITKGKNGLASFLTIFFVIVVLSGPAFFIGNAIFHQTQSAYNSFVENKETNGDTFGWIQKVDQKINAVLPEQINFDTNQKLGEFLSFLSQNITKIFTGTVQTIFSTLLIILTIFYFLKDGRQWKDEVILLSPLSKSDDLEIIDKTRTAVNGILGGYLLVGLCQGILMTVGLAIFHVPNPAIWGLITAFASLVPTIGTAVVAIPAILYLFSTGQTSAAVGLIVWCAVIVGTVDNVISPIFVGSKISIQPIFILFSVLGGIALLGPVGLLVGPLTLSLTYTLAGIYRKKYKTG